jgi:hypothetical protein
MLSSRDVLYIPIATSCWVAIGCRAHGKTRPSVGVMHGGCGTTTGMESLD